MKKTKPTDRLKNAFEVFFNEPQTDENQSLEYVGGESVSTTEGSSFCSGKSRKILDVLRQLFLFLPAAFLLFLATVAITVRSIYFPPGANGVSFFGFIIVFGLSLTTILGLGNWRNPKHAAIPLSIISVGFGLGAVGNLFYDLFGSMTVPYFFPLALVAAVLTKNRIDEYENHLERK